MKMILGVFFLSVSMAAQALYCGNRLVVEGDSLFSVIAKCGQPDLSRQYTKVVSYPTYYGGLITRTVEVEEFTYNFGPRKFIRILRFIDGRLDRIETDGYGFTD